MPKYDTQGRPLAICRRHVRGCKNIVEKFDDTLCKKCKQHDKAKKKKIIRNQRAIGIKQRRNRKKKINWKSPVEKFDFNPTKIIYAKREGKVVFTKHSLAEDWQSKTRQQFSSIEKRYSIVWNPMSSQSNNLQLQ
jgi:hypothetical protein